MIENLKILEGEFQFKTKEVQDAKLRENSGWELGREKCSKHFFEIIEYRNQTISTDTKKTKYSSNPVIILAKPATRFYENLYTKETASKTATSDFLGKPLT